MFMAQKSDIAFSPKRRPETEVLLSCARTRMDSDATERLKAALKNEIDWSFVVDEAARHGIVPLLFRNLSRIVQGVVPGERLKQIGRAAGAIAYRNLLLTGELLILLRLFGQHGVRALPLKGPVLGILAYGDLSLRSFSDLDILMPQGDILKAKDILLQREYQPALQLSSSEERTYVQTHHDYQFHRARDAAIVEIQWALTQWSFAFPMDFDEIWERREQIPLAGATVPTIGTEDLLLALCVHGAKHRWERLKWICDIAQLLGVAQDSIAWGRLQVSARARGGERMLLLGLFLAHDLLDARLPVEVRQAIHRDSQVKFLAGSVSQGLLERNSKSDDLSDERPFFYCRVRERLGDKLAIAIRYFPEYLHRMLVPNDRDRAFFQLPAFLSAGYYLLRPVRLIKDYCSESRARFGTGGTPDS